MDSSIHKKNKDASNLDELSEFDESELEDLYAWIDGIPLSRPKRNIGRDFSDGVLVAELVNHFFPKIVQLHNYVPANATKQKLENWEMLNRRYPLPPYRLLFPISSKGSFIITVPQTRQHIPLPLMNQLWTTVLVAEIIKHFHPKWVELHNYPPANSTEQKMQNWFLLNRKVFNRLNFTLSDDVIRSVCKCTPTVIEKILMHLRIKISRKMWDTQKTQASGKQGRTSQMANDKPEADQNMYMHATGPLSPGRQQQKLPEVATHTGPYKGTKSKPFPDADMVPKVLLEEKEQEILAKEETVQILNAKVRRLEHLLHLKDIRIDDLQKRVEFQRPTGKKL